MDFIDIIEGRYYKTHTGRYYPVLPKLFTGTLSDLYNSDTGIDFDYEPVDPTAWRYRNIINNLSDKQSADATIKTCEADEWKVGAHVLLDNGRLCMILSVSEDVQAASREAARLMPIPPGTEWVIRLVEVDNPWGLA